MNIEKVLKQAVEEYKEFAYDGCHKIYIIENEEEKQKDLDKPSLIPQF